jgi:biotin operon repressor
MSARLKPGSQNALIVAALEANGGWMSTAQIHRAAGFSRLNSRIAELREYGYEIPSRHVEGKVGPHGHEYRLVATPRAERTNDTEATAAPTSTVSPRSAQGAVQLTLEVAA